MKILAIEKIGNKITSEQFHPHLKEEAKHVWELFKSGVVREINFTIKDNRAVLVLECKDEVEAESLLNNLPLVKENLIHFEILPLKNYDGFERLFTKEGNTK